jgi:hypothetical protein
MCRLGLSWPRPYPIVGNPQVTCIDSVYHQGGRPVVSDDALTHNGVNNSSARELHS